LINKILIFIICSIVYISQDFIDRFIYHYSNLDTYSLEFDFITKNQDKIVYSQKGTLFFSKGKFKIVLTDLIFLYDGENHYTIIPENKEVNISVKNEISNYIIPSRIASTISRIRDKIKMKNLFEISYMDESGTNYLIFIKNDFSITRIDQSINDGYINSIIFNKTDHNKEIDDNLFYFDIKKYEGYYLNRL
tara:strand:- start:284 stop:859 length:576 start_codon:yes stop_codon:yes gene_type:complete